MRVLVLSIAVLANVFGAVALESLSDFVKDFPQCSLSAFKKALEKEGCDTTSVGTPTFDCLCKHLTSIVVTMSTSGIDANCNASKKPTCLSYVINCFNMLTYLLFRLEFCPHWSMRQLWAV